MTAGARMYVLREKEACTHIEEKRNKLQTYMQVDMCGVRPCSRRERETEKKKTSCKHASKWTCVVSYREKEKQAPNMHASGHVWC